MTPKNVPLVIYQGATFLHPFYWYSDEEVVKPITAVTLTYPARFTATAHGLPTTALPATILGVADWIDTGLNLAGRILVTKVDVDTFTAPVSAIDESAYDGSGGVLVYNAPMQLATGWIARMQIRASKDDDTVLAEFTSAGGQITLDNDGGIIVEDTDAVTDALDFTSAVYDLELEDDDGNVYRVAEGKVTLSKQVTRPVP